MPFIWQDREIRFDLLAKLLLCRQGEKVIEEIPKVEDTKGNNGERGYLIVTNLRLIWYCELKPKLNLSIGLDVILGCGIETNTSMVHGNQMQLILRTRY